MTAESAAAARSGLTVSSVLAAIASVSRGASGAAAGRDRIRGAGVRDSSSSGAGTAAAYSAAGVWRMRRPRGARAAAKAAVRTCEEAPSILAIAGANDTAFAITSVKGGAAWAAAAASAIPIPRTSSGFCL